jgi:hypothetical protein
LLVGANEILCPNRFGQQRDAHQDRSRKKHPTKTENPSQNRKETEQKSGHKRDTVAMA